MSLEKILCAQIIMAEDDHAACREFNREPGCSSKDVVNITKVPAERTGWYIYTVWFML